MLLIFKWLNQIKLLLPLKFNKNIINIKLIIIENLIIKSLDIVLLICVFILIEFFDLFKLEDFILIIRKKKTINDSTYNINTGNEIS